MFEGMGGIWRPFCKSGHEWSKCLQQWMGLGKLYVGTGRIGQTFYMRLVKFSAGVSETEGIKMKGIGQTFIKRWSDWSNFMYEKVRLDTLFAVRMSGIGQTFCRTGQKYTELSHPLQVLKVFIQLSAFCPSYFLTHHLERNKHKQYINVQYFLYKDRETDRKRYGIWTK